MIFKKKRKPQQNPSLDISEVHHLRRTIIQLIVIEKMQAPLDTVVKVSNTVDKAHDASLEALANTKEYIEKNAEVIKTKGAVSKTRRLYCMLLIHHTFKLFCCVKSSFDKFRFGVFGFIIITVFDFYR